MVSYYGDVTWKLWNLIPLSPIMWRFHRVTHVLLNWESEFSNIINSDYRTIQITVYVLHGVSFCTWGKAHTWPRTTPGPISHVHILVWSSIFDRKGIHQVISIWMPVWREMMGSKARREMRFREGFRHTGLMWATFEVSAVCEMSC